MMAAFFNEHMGIDDALLSVLAHLPTRSLSSLVEPKFWQRLSDANVMRIAVHLARKSYDEGGCPIGGVIIDIATRKILGKGHNTLVQDNDPYNHGETSAMRDAGSIDFSNTILFTTLTPCNVCACLVVERGFKQIVIGNSPNPTNNEESMRKLGLDVRLLLDQAGISLYAKFQAEKPGLDLIDWKGVAALKTLQAEG